MRVTDLLRTIDLFEQLSSEELDQLAGWFKDRQVHRGEVLLSQGQPVHAMFIVHSGSIELVTAGNDGRAPAARQCTAGDTVGEIAMLLGEVHPSTATALTESRVFELDRDAFESLVTARPQLMRAMVAGVSRRAVRRMLTEEATTASEASGRVYAVFSPRGGSGKTTLATRLAVRMAELLPQRVALLDLDLLFDDAALLLNLTPTTSLADFSDEEVQHLDPRALSRDVVEHESSLRVLVGALRPEDGERVTAAHVLSALVAMKRQFLVTIVDCGSTLAPATLAALATAERLLVLCTPELATLRDIRDCQRIFGQALHLDKSRVTYIYNHPLPSEGLTRLQFESALEQTVALEIPHAGEWAVKPGFAKAVEQLARELLPPEAATGDEMASVRAASAAQAPSAGKRLLQLLGRGNGR